MILPRFHFVNDFTPFPELILAHGGVRENVPKGATLYEAHAQERTHSYYVESGVTKLTMINEEGTENILFFMGKGSIYPINRFSDTFSMEYFMHLTAVTDLTVIRFPSSQLVDMAQADRAFTEAIIDHYCRYCNLLLAKNLLNTYNDSEQLVCSFLYLYVYDRPALQNMVDMTQEEIGKITGLSRMQITRIVNHLRTDHIIETHRGRIQILRLSELKKRCAALINGPEG